MARAWFRAAWVAGSLIVLSTVGCGGKDERVPVAKTTGKLEWPGHSVRGLMVVLHPTDPGGSKMPFQPTGVVHEDGTFAITCYEVSDGAPAGEYVVTIRTAPLPDDVPTPKMPPAKYRDPKTSPLRVTIEKKPLNNLPPLVIAG